ncbi:MAG: hypothetical protein ACREE6_13680 [Limisphaerales bacterium]
MDTGDMKALWILLLCLTVVGVKAGVTEAVPASKPAVVQPLRNELNVKRAVPARQSLVNGTQATRLAIQLANKRAGFLYNCQPFHDGQPASFRNGQWHWTEFCAGDYEATIDLAANGAKNQVMVYWLDDSNDSGLEYRSFHWRIP